MKALPLSPKITFLKPGCIVSVSTSSGLSELTLRSIKPIGRYFSISFLGVEDRASAVRYRDSLVRVKKETIPLEEGEFFCDDLIGLTVVTADGAVIGKVAGIIETGSNDVYIVRDTDREYLIPAIRDVVKQIDQRGGRILIEIMEGLLN